MTRPCRVKSFDSLDSLVQHSKLPTAWSNPNTKDQPSGWNGNVTLDGARELASKGWTEGRDKLKSRVENIFAHLTPAMTALDTMDVAGAYPIAALAAAGDPLSMVNPIPTEDKKKSIIRLLVSVSASSFYEGDELTNFGAAMAVIVECIEALGHRVEIELIAYHSCRGRADIATKVIVKRAEDYTDNDRIAYCLTHPSFLRRIMFSSLEKEADFESYYTSNYGMPQPPEDTKAWIDPGQTFLPGVNCVDQKSLRNPESALRALEPVIRKSLDHELYLPPLFGIDKDF